MAIWQTPIYDRTQADVDAAKQQLREWRISGGTIVDLKGCFNISDLNRIEQNTEFLKDLLNSRGYQIVITTKYDWKYSDIPLKADISRVINNIDAIHKAFPITDFVDLPETISNYETVNLLEKALAKLYYYVDFIINHYCDTFHSGSNFFLPLGGN